MAKHSVAQKSASLSAAKRAASAPSKPVVTKPIAAAPIAAAPIAAAPVASAPAEQPASAPAEQPAAAPVAAVPIRGGLAIAKVKFTGKQYRVGADHNKKWWDIIVATLGASGGVAGVADIVKAGVPVTFVGYTVRRGYMAAAE